MIVNNLIKKIESLGGVVTITATPAQWGGWNVELTSRIGRYYDVRIHEQIRKTLDLRTEQDAIDVLKIKDVSYYGVKPWHDEDDMQSDYHAYNFSYKLKDLDRYADWAKDETRRLAPEREA